MPKAAKVFLDDIHGDYGGVIRKGLSWIEFDKLVTPKSRIFVKPNLTFPTYREGVMTSPEAVEAALLAIREYTPHVFFGDSDSGGYNRFSMDEVYRETGLARFAGQHSIELVNLSRLESKKVEFTAAGRKFALDLPRLLVDDIDLLVTMPVPKIHMNTGVSLTFKNQWGCIPEPSDRLRLHPHFSHVVLEVNRIVKARVAIIDGKYGLNMSGPLRGSAVPLGWLMVADDIGAGARVACELMQLPLERVPHLAHASRKGHVPTLDQIQLNQDFRPFIKDRFYLKRQWTDYPGLLAFRYPPIAYLAYFSPLAKVMHKLLYIFREPFY